MKLSAICATALVVAVPSMGSRLEDATVSDAKRAELVLAQLHSSNPVMRNTISMKVEPAGHIQLAALDPQPRLAIVPRIGAPARSDTAAQPAPGHITAYGAQVHVDGPHAPIASLRPKARALSEIVTQPVQVSTQGAGVAPMALGDLLAPAASLRPAARPDSLMRGRVQYTRRWLRDVPLREMTAEEACLTTAIYHEARGETIEGQFAVAEVILNRVDSRRFPNTICGVVYQGARGQIGSCQFSFACDGRSEAMPNRAAARKAQRIAQVMADGGRRGLTAGALFFHTTAVNPSWAARFTRTSQIGAHLFYRG